MERIAQESVPVDADTRDDVDLMLETATLDAAPLKPAGRDRETKGVPGTGRSRVRDDRVGPLRKLDIASYGELITPLHVELLKLQNHIRATGWQVITIFKGRDAAGKGGTIKCFMRKGTPRPSRACSSIPDFPNWIAVRAASCINFR